MFVNAPCPMIVPYSDYLLGVLNSKIADWYIRHLGVTRNGGYFEYKPMFVEKLPVPPAEQRVKQLIACNLHTNTIDREIYNLYGLSSDEVAFIERG